MALVSASTMATNWGELLDRTGQDTTSSDLDSFLAGPDEPPSLSITQVDSALGLFTHTMNRSLRITILESVSVLYSPKMAAVEA